MKARLCTLIVFVFTLFVPTFGQAPIQRYDLLIRNGRVLDGSGNPGLAADVGVRDGRIAAIGRLGSGAAARVIDAHGLTVAPVMTPDRR